MIFAKIQVTGACARVIWSKDVPAGLKGGRILIEYDDDWAELGKLITFRGCCSMDVAGTAEPVEIPAETVASPTARLQVGITGTGDGGATVTPTFWAELGRVRPASNVSGNTPAANTPEVWQQILALIGDLGGLSTENKATLVAAVNEVYDRQDSGGNVDLTGVVRSVNGITPDESGNVEIEIPESGGSGLTAEQISALDGMFKICAYTEDASTAYTAFKTAFGIVEPEEPEATLSSISAVYSGGDVAVGTAVTALTGIVVTAHYSDGTSATVTGYTLSGTIAEGSNTITVSYSGMTATFTVVGIAEEPEEPEATLTSISATYSGGEVTAGTPLTDLTGIVVTATYSDGSTATVTDYTLSGEIAEGDNTITASYGGMTATITVTGVAEETDTKVYITDSLTWESGYYIPNNGTISENANWQTSDYYDISEYSVIGWEDIADATLLTARVAYFDADKNYLSSDNAFFRQSNANYPSPVEWEMPENTAYIRAGTNSVLTRFAIYLM